MLVIEEFSKKLKAILPEKFRVCTHVFYRSNIITMLDTELLLTAKKNANGYELYIIDRLMVDICLDKEIELVGKSLHQRYFQKDLSEIQILNAYLEILCEVDKQEKI